jgi:hypothetical protein
MRTGGAEDEHGVGARHGHVESANIRLAVFEWDVATVHAAFERRARCFCSALCCGMVAVAELKLDNIADCCDYRIGCKGILWAADHNRDDLVSSGNCRDQPLHRLGRSSVYASTNSTGKVSLDCNQGIVRTYTSTCAS